MTRLIFACASLASMTLPAIALAGPADPGTREVRYDDLDLSTAAGMKAIQRRIENALDDVCYDPNGPGPAGAVNTACKSAGRRAAYAQVEIASARQQASRRIDGTRQAIAIPAARASDLPTH